MINDMMLWSTWVNSNNILIVESCISFMVGKIPEILIKQIVKKELWSIFVTMTVVLKNS